MADDFFTQIVRAFGPGEQLEETVRQRLMRTGFARVESSGIFGADRFFTADQIDAVEARKVMLNIQAEDMIGSCT